MLKASRCDRHGDAACPCRIPVAASLLRPDGPAAQLRFTVETMHGAPAEGECIDLAGADGPRRDRFNA